MSEQELQNLFFENISLQLRHPAYKRTLEIRDFAHMMTTGDGQDEEVTRYRRFEETDLKAQRKRLYNPLTKYALARPRKYWKKVGRVEGVRKTITGGNEKTVQELEAQFYNFQPGKDLQTWLNEKLEYFGVTDPNKWIIYERADRRNIEGQITQTKVWPFVIDSVNALNWEYQYGELLWFLCRAINVERIVKDGQVRESLLENFYLYAPGLIFRAREVGEKTVQEPNEEQITLEVYPGDTSYKVGDGFPAYTSAKKNRAFYFSIIQNGTTEVPALPCGCYMDERTGENVFVPWFDPAEHVFYDMIRDKSFLDVVKTVHTYPRRTEYVKPCRFRDSEGSECVGGYLNDIRDSDHLCPVCRGSGKAANFTTEQEVLQLIMPDTPEGLVELNKLAFTEPVDISLPDFLAKEVEMAEKRIMAAVFDSGMFQKPNNSQARTATEIDAVMEGISDVLSPFARLLSLHFELAHRIAAQYMEITDFAVDHSFPDDLDIANLAELVAGFDAIKASGVGFEAVQAQRGRVFQKVFEGDPETQKRIAARYKWLPFDDKTQEEVAMILAARSALDDTRILRENWLEIFREIESETPAFPDMEFNRQREVVAAKVAEFKTRITLIDAQPDMAGALQDINAQPDNANLGGL